MSSSFRYLDIAFALLGLVITVRLLLTRHREVSLPPGPKGLPIIGNVLSMPSSHEWLTFSKWADRWGNIISLNLLGQPMIILNAYEHAVEMLDKKSSIYSDRPTLVMGGELLGFENTLVLLHYGNRFREFRRMVGRKMGSKAAVERLHPLIDNETRKFLHRLLSTPEQVHAHIRKTAGAIILMIVYGYPVQEGADSFVDLADRVLQYFSIACTPGTFFVDICPILRYLPAWFPGAGFLKLAARWREELLDLVNVPFNLVKKRMKEGTSVPSYTSELLETEGLTSEKVSNIKWSAASIYSGGADTTVSAIYSFFLAMTLNPQAQIKAQEEIDRVIGNDRLPCFADRENLPYVEALVKEVLRLNPVAPLGVPHRATIDDVHAGYYIPKGSIVVANIWHMVHDPSEYSDPFLFNPDRFLGEKAERDPKELVFGFGRRICPGSDLADASVWLSCAITLASFNISKAVENGTIVEPLNEYVSGTISHPKDFVCSIKPRFSNVQDLVLSEL